LQQSRVQHIFNVIENFIGSDTHPLSDPRLELVIGDLFFSKLKKEVLVSIFQSIFELLS
jgi:hypothetical protein